MGAVDVILNKQSLNKVSAPVLTWSLFTLSIPPLIFIVIRSGVPDLNQIFFVGTIGSSLAFVFSKTITNHTLKQNLLSKVFPLTAFSGIFTYIFGLILLSETIRLTPLLGVLSVILGSYILNADQAKEDFLMPFKLLFTKKASIFFLIAIMLGSITAVFDKLAMNNTMPTNPAFTILVEQVIMSAMLTAYLLRIESKTWVNQLKDNFWILFLNSIVFLIVVFLVFYAYIGGPVVLVLGIKRLQIFFILLMSYFL
ncbi:MAG: hypothetical protein Q8O88_00015, partial [bacterium]|nr:hypothetical protein [bacterium]